MNNNKNENIDEALDFFQGEEYEKRREERHQQDQRAQYAAKYYEALVTHSPSTRTTINQTSTKQTQKVVVRPRQINQSKQKSIGNSKRTKDTNRKQTNILKTKIANIIKKNLPALGLALLLSVGILSQIDDIQRIKTVKECTNYLKLEAQMNLIQHNLAGFDAETGEFSVKENTTSDYMQLEITDDLDVYIYDLVIPSTEDQKFINAVSINGGNSNYTSMEQFLRINGYFENGHPSSLVFGNFMEAEILENANKIKQEMQDLEIANGGVLTIETLTESEAKGRGGK